MKTYIADIIPKIQRFSQKLDNLTMLTNQHWVVLDELNHSKTVYIFRNNGELLIAVNGNVEKAKWEYLGQNSILIDSKENSYLFRHGFFDENILALKIDSKDEYAVLVNETKFAGELNSINSVTNFLNENYITNPKVIESRLLGISPKSSEVQYKRDGYTLKMGKFEEFALSVGNNNYCLFYKKKSNGRYFIYHYDDEILMFDERQSCIDFLKNRIWL